MNNNLFKNSKGVALMEVIVALGVIVTGVIGGLYLTSYNLRISINSEHRLIAANLARESIEVVRQIRDSNWLADEVWNEYLMVDDSNYSFTANFNSADGSWALVSQGIDDLKACGQDCLLYINEVTDSYSHESSAGNNPSAFSRLITLRQICWSDISEAEIVLPLGQTCAINNPLNEYIGWQVESSVVWEEPGYEGQADIIDKIYDWK